MTSSTRATGIFVAYCASGIHVVDQDRHRPQLGLGAVDGGADLVGVRDVERQRDADPAGGRDLAGQLLQPHLAAGGRRHLRPHAASTTAKRRPSPELAPVTSATWPDRSMEKFGSSPRIPRSPWRPRRDRTELVAEAGA